MHKKNQTHHQSEKVLQNLAQLDVRELERLVKYHNKKYFVDNAPEISDEAFDKLTEALRHKDPNNEALFEIKEVISQEVVHKTQMLSLDKCYDDETFLKWLEKIEGSVLACPKIDGVACSIIYDRSGNLTLAATRGDGKKGENITKNIKEIPSVPHQIPLQNLENNYFEVRGEVFMPIKTFNQRFAQDFSNPRNLAAGIIKLKEVDPKKSSHLEFLPYDLKGDNLETLEEKLHMVNSFGFKLMPFLLSHNQKDALNNFKHYLEEVKSYPFETDGVVFKANVVKEQQKLGHTNHHPRFAIAYKFQTEFAQTKVKDVVWSVGRSGTITPVAIFDPVHLSGATITRASLHNLGNFQKLGIKKNSLVQISRRGGVIPKLEQVLSVGNGDFNPPTRCPACQNDVIKERDFLFCRFKNKCSNVAESSFIHFCKALGMEGLGPKLIKKLHTQGFLQEFSDIFLLTEEKLMSIERMGTVLAQKILQEINNAKNVSLAQFIYALGISEVGEHIAQLITANFKDVGDIFSTTTEDLEKIHGIGTQIACSFIAGIKELKPQIVRLLDFISIDIKTSADLTNKTLLNKSFVFTGSLSIERKTAKELVKKAGGVVKDSVSKDTDYLVKAGEKPSKKYDIARKLILEGHKISIISEAEFLHLVEGK